jgi:hypothetical protein
MFSTRQFGIPHKEFFDQQANQSNNSIFSIRRAFDVYGDLARCGSRNLYQTIGDIRYTPKHTYMQMLSHLLLRATEAEYKFPIVSGGFVKITHEIYNSQPTVLDALQHLNVSIPTHHYYINGIEYTAQNPRIHIVYVNSGMSILKTMLTREQNLERMTAVENLITAYVTKNTTVNRGLFNCFVVKDLFPYNNNYTENYTIFVDFVNTVVLEALVIAQAVISRTMITDPELITTNIQFIQDFLASANANKELTDTQFKVSCQTLLTKICDIIMTIAQSNEINSTKEEQFYNQTAPFFITFYELLYCMYKDTTQSDFSTKLCEAYNTITLGRDRETVKNNEKRIEEYYAKIQELQVELTAAQHRANLAEPYTIESVQEMFKIMEIFKNITLKESNPEYLVLEVCSPLTFFDSEEAKILFKNTNSDLNREIMYQANDRGLNRFALKSAFLDIFMRRQYIIHTFSTFKLRVNTNINLNYSNPRPVNIEAYNTSYRVNDKGLIAHPHIMRFSCWGQAQTAFYKAFGQQNFESAFAQLVGATQNLTMSDNTVVKYFVEQLIQYWDKPTITEAGPTTESKLISLREIYNKKLAEGAGESTEGE